MNRGNEFDLNQDPHRRLNPLTGEWVQVSPHRAKRPWQGRQENPDMERIERYDAGCYLCPGNERAGGVKNPDYTSTYVFENDFSALEPATPSGEYNNRGLLIARSERGICRVICFSPRHDLTLSGMQPAQLNDVVDLWTEQYRELSGRPYINYVQIFENKGKMMGCSNPHPHGQIWAQESIPDEPLKELRHQLDYYEKRGSTLLGDYLGLELKLGERIVAENRDFVALVPYWAFWPFETLLVSRRPFGGFTDMSGQERHSLADLIRRVTTKYDHLFQVSFPYSAGFHPAPTDGETHPEWHFHMHFYPPLLRSAQVKKFRVGYEMLANLQRDITAEYSAEVLRQLPDS